MTTITPTIRALYNRLSSHPVSMLVGFAADCALRDARTIARFRELEAQNLVRMTSEHEQENYFDVYGREDNPKYQKAMEETLNRLGCYYVAAEYFDGKDWQTADGIGMCVYKNPESPFENCYVAGMMAAAIEKAEARIQEPAERLHWEQRDTMTVDS